MKSDTQKIKAREDTSSQNFIDCLHNFFYSLFCCCCFLRRSKKNDWTKIHPYIQKLNENDSPFLEKMRCDDFLGHGFNKMDESFIFEPRPEMSPMRSFSIHQFSSIVLDTPRKSQEEDFNINGRGDYSRIELNKTFVCESFENKEDGDFRMNEKLTLVIGPEPIDPDEVKEYIQPANKTPSFELLILEYDIRDYLMKEESIAKILDLIFGTPHIRELRVRIDNWRNFTHQIDNVLPHKKIKTPKLSSCSELETLIVYCPGIKIDQLLKWRSFLASQPSLQTLICNFDSIQWTFYDSILRRLKNSLVKLELYSLTNQNGPMDQPKLFNWLIIDKLKSLKFLKIWGDSHYYGLRHNNLLHSNFEFVEEIELKYVDLNIKEMQHLLLRLSNLKGLNLQFFTPIPTPESLLPPAEFLEAIALALSLNKFKSLSFTDYNLPGSLEMRSNFLAQFCEHYGYSAIWTQPEDPTILRKFDFMSFEQSIELDSTDE